MKPSHKDLERSEMPIVPAISGPGQTAIRVVVKHPEVEHSVRIRDFETWLESAGRSPAEMSLKTRLRELLSK